MTVYIGADDVALILRSMQYNRMDKTDCLKIIRQWLILDSTIIYEKGVQVIGLHRKLECFKFLGASKNGASFRN